MRKCQSRFIMQMFGSLPRLSSLVTWLGDSLKQHTEILFLLPIDVICRCHNDMRYVINWIHELVLIHVFMHKPVDWQYVVNLNCYCVFCKNQKTPSLRLLWKGHNNNIRFQTKDDVIVKPNGTVMKSFDPRGNHTLKVRMV